MREHKIPKSLIFLFAALFIGSVTVIHAAPLKTIKDMPGYSYVPSNATSIIEYRSAYGDLYGFSQGNNSALILNIPLPSLVLNKGNILNDLNLTGVRFSLYSDYKGTSIFRISNASVSSINPSGSNISGLINLTSHFAALNNLSLYVSDSVGSYVFIGTLTAVKECISLAESGSAGAAVQNRINVDANFSAFSYLNGSNGARSLSLNSTGNLTSVSVTFVTYSDFYIFRSELLSLQVAGQLGNATLSDSGLTETLQFHMNLHEFSLFVAGHSSFISGQGIT